MQLQLLTFDFLYLVLITLLLVRFLLNRSNLTTLATVCLTSSLSFAFFETPWALFPLVSYLLKDCFLQVFTWLKTSLFKWKNSLFSGNKEEEKEGVLAMKGKEAVPIADETPNPVNTEDQSNNSQDNPFVVNKEGQVVLRVVGTPEKVKAELEIDAQGAVAISNSLVGGFLYGSYVLVLFHTVIPLCIGHLDKYGHTVAGRRYATRNVAATAIFILTTLSLLKFRGTGNDLPRLAKKSMEILFTEAVHIEDSAENADQLELLRKRLAEVLRKNMISASSVSGEFFEVAQEKASEFVFCWIEGLTQLTKEGKVNVNLDCFDELSEQEKIKLINGYNCLPQESKLFLKEHCTPFYEKIIKINDLLGGFSRMELVNSTPTQTSISSQQDDAPTISQAPRPPEPLLTQLKITPAGYLPDPNDPYKRILYRSLEQEEEDITPKDSYETFSTTYRPDDARKQAIDQIKGQLKRVEGLTANYPNQARPSRLDQHPAGSDFLSVPDQFGSPSHSPGSRRDRLSFSLYQDDTNPPMENRSSGDQLVSREPSPSRSDDDLPFSSASPLEPFEKDRYEELAGFWLCVGALLGTSRVALAVLRKLSYTQNLVKKLTDKGIPKKLFFWIYHPNPGPLPEKPLFCLMVCILVGNLIILYVLMKMLHLIS